MQTRRAQITHRRVRANGITLHVAEAGSGPPVVLLHGFPELWYSWRHQLPALAAAGYRALAPDARGCGATTAPASTAAYRMRCQMDDVSGLLDALGEQEAALVGHDWGANTVWACGQLRPWRFPALGVLSVPYSPRPPVPMTRHLRSLTEGRFNWLLYAQEPGAAEAELEAAPRRALRRFMWALSGGAPDGLAQHLLTGLPEGASLLESIPCPAPRPEWLSEADLDYYAAEYGRTGFTGALNRYRCVDMDWHELPRLGATPVEAPVLFIAGEKETAVRAGGLGPTREYVDRLEPPAVLPACGHWVQQERPERTNELLIDFLRERYPATGRRSPVPEGKPTDRSGRR
ncbi:alpha/beta fold hydrolase [Nocardiopsis suaedae]|uniref:Alpha/beta hydrolase n=1 Tax=Nocardiopsis suaedae TaxID=3018444 RepID=A0ABT4TL13_9ACTN|nr:alpha/beta hydrolase [Nocardiopsis suaedae]MDA2805373.1 alpha/beta hydrolase [Nocardiopsis suaedae]